MAVIVAELNDTLFGWKAHFGIAEVLVLCAALLPCSGRGAEPSVARAAQRSR